MTHSGADGLQQVVDALASRLGRSVAVDDTRGHLVVASRHFGDEDPLRTYAVMQRSSDPRVVAHFRAHGIHDWTAPGRIPGSTELAFKARICCPVRAGGLPLGHLFLIDDGVGERDVELAAEAAGEIGRLLHGRLVLHERDQERREALTRALVGPDADARADARRDLLDEHLAEVLDPALALAVHVEGGPDAALRLALERLARSRPGDRTLTATAGRAGTVLLLGASATGEQGRAVAERLGAELRRARHGGRAVVGLGPAGRGPDAAHDSHEEARRAAEAAVLLPELGDVVGPEDLGVYPVLLALPRTVAGPGLYPAALRRLLDHETHDGLVDTLETYLDCSGDATRTAAALRVHRSTLYYRLGRIEALTGADLHDGEHRLALHLGIKLRRVLGAHDRAAPRAGR